MTKIAILGDTHLGVKSGSNHFSQFQNTFFREVFYPYLAQNKISEVIQLGDFFDNRTALSIKAYNACKETWLRPIVDNDIRMHILVGNHDALHKNTIDVNTPELILKSEFSDNIEIYSSPSLLDIDGTSISMIPWICDDNKQEVYNFMSGNKTDLCCGHFEIEGFEMMRGVAGHGGLPKDLFDQYELTLSGHYHTKSFNDTHRILYVGTPYELTFADIHDPRGFHVFDTATRKLEFVQNPNTMFEKLFYNDGCAYDITTLKGKSLKIVVEKKTDIKAFDRFVDSVKLVDPYELQVIENFAELHSVELNTEINVADTNDVLVKYVDSIETAVDKKRLKEYLQGLYVEAMHA